MVATGLTPGDEGATALQKVIYDPLTYLDPQTNTVSNLAAASITSHDQRVWTIGVARGRTFSNGDPVTAQSFADSWNRVAYAPNRLTDNQSMNVIEGYVALNPPSGQPSAKSMSGVQVVNRYTLRVTLTAPLSLFRYVLSYVAFAPVPREAASDPTAYTKHPIGNGPYELVGAFAPNQSTPLTVKRWTHYLGPRPGHVQQIQAKLYSTFGSVTYADFRAGNLDLLSVPQSSGADALRAYPQRSAKTTLASLFYLGFPLWERRFADVRVREAFALSIDRSAIVKSIFQGIGTPAAGVAASSAVGGGAATCMTCTTDPAKARQLLASAGGWHGSLTLWTYQDPTNMQVLQAIANQLKTNLGIGGITIKAQPVSQLYPSLAAHTIDGPFYLYWGAAYPHVYALANSLFSASAQGNTTGYRSARFQSLIAKAAGAAAPADTVSFARQAVTAALNDVPLTPIGEPGVVTVWSKRVGNVHVATLGGADLRAVTLT
ncbi:MAG: ABC transporter substrate-binding protein [Jatrophihabitans sp.]